MLVIIVSSSVRTNIVYKLLCSLMSIITLRNNGHILLKIPKKALRKQSPLRAIGAELKLFLNFFPRLHLPFQKDCMDFVYLFYALIILEQKKIDFYYNKTE